MVPEVLKGFVLLALIFGPLEQLCGLRHQKLWRSGWATDTFYYFSGYFVGRLGAGLALWLAMHGVAWGIPPTWQSAIAAQPTGLQLIEAVVIADAGYYLAHRLLHTVPLLWRFHAIHHSVEQMDWLATVRVHPLDQIFTKLFQMVPLYALGFSAKTFVSYALFSAAIAFLIHSNLRLRFGPLRWLVATPEFHHWHHSYDPQIKNCNLAAQLPLIDWLFGSLHCPAKARPRTFGISDPVPEGYLGQFFYPLHKPDNINSLR